VRALGRYGYRVLSAADGAEAVRLVEESGDKIHVVLTDLVMPGMSGRELAGVLTAIRPGLRLVFTSGYTESGITHQNVIDARAAYIQKPYTAELLAERVRDVLGPDDAAATILVVEDDEGVRHFIRSVLTGARYAVMEAANGRRAIEIVAGGLIDLVITDLVMPEQEGIETIRQMNRDYPSLKIIAISGALGGDMLDRVARLGAHATLPKPVSAGELLQRVQHVLRGSDAASVVTSS
jgi:CheY-like chemotaxis protein